VPGADWKSKEAYRDARKAEAADIAWEWLRRNCGYQRDYMALAAKRIIRRHGGPLPTAVGAVLLQLIRKRRSNNKPFSEPEVLSTVLSVRASVCSTASKRYDLDFSKPAGQGASLRWTDGMPSWRWEERSVPVAYANLHRAPHRLPSTCRSIAISRFVFGQLTDFRWRSNGGPLDHLLSLPSGDANLDPSSAHPCLACSRWVAERK